jgi:hypothetical protein
MQKREREPAEPRTFCFITYYQPGSYGWDECVAKNVQAASRVRWMTDYHDKPWAQLKEGESKMLSQDELVIRLPMTTDLANRQVLPLPKKKSSDQQDSSSFSDESYETRQARDYLRYA